jgi:hypothetical protein
VESYARTDRSNQGNANLDSLNTPKNEETPVMIQSPLKETASGSKIQSRSDNKYPSMQSSVLKQDSALKDRLKT